MANIEIIEENYDKYKKLLSIKQGTRASNNACVYVPALLLTLVSVLLLSVTFLGPYFSVFMPELVSYLSTLVLYLIGLGISTKLTVELSKSMSLHYFKKKYPDIDTNVSTKELKTLLNNYRHTKYPEHDKSRYDRYQPIKKKKKTLKEKKKDLEKEKEFLIHYKDEQLEADKVIKKKL